MRKQIQQSLILAMCALSPALSLAATLNEDQARTVAAEFFQSGKITRLADKNAFTLVYTATGDTSEPVCYVFNAKDGKGFIIVSADSSSMPVIGYSDTSVWAPNSIPGAAENILGRPVEQPVSNGMNRVRKYAQHSQIVLSTPEWSQEAPFNSHIPNRRLTGCVGVALAEILKYHNYPEMRPASLVESGEATTYAWNNMRNGNYRDGYDLAEADAVGTLVADAAIAIGTDFGMSSSSAFEVKVPYALTSMFGYDAGVSYKKRAEMDKASWDAVIVNEIDAGRPVLYSGQDVSSGHAFVCDGYEMRGDTPFFHINWGWGGSANGYYASDALNPVVSKQHKYNDLTTIVYNIKPSENVAIMWSPLHITSDERQVGLSLDVDELAPGLAFSLRAGAIKNISNTDFAGRLAVALFDAQGHRKALLNDGRNFSLVALQINKYVDFSCKVPSDVTVADGDVVRLVSQASDGADWLPVAGDLLATGEAKAKGGSLAYFNVNIPAGVSDVEVTVGDPRVVKGRDFTFRVVPTATDKVVTVKANGFILTPDANHNYRLTNVLADQNIDIIVQNAADVLTKSVLWLQAGQLEKMFDEKESATVTDLTLFGTMNVNDFNFIRERMKLQRLDISQVSIVACGSSPANAIPTKAFVGCRSLQSIILPNNLTTFKNGCLAQTGLRSIDIPASVGTFEYNVFVGCSSLREVISRRSAPAWVNWCVFSGVPQDKLIVPVGSAAAYSAKEYWQDFKVIEEGLPEPPSTFFVTVAEKKGLKFTSLTEGTEFNKGDKYDFMLETDDSFEDAVMHVYCNSTLLNADADGVYHATINANTLIHVEFTQPQPTTVDQTWKLTGDVGGLGLVSEIVNVPAGRMFTVRANAIKVPKGDDAAKFYGIVLTDKDGAIKEFISSIISNYYSRTGENLTYNFYCQVKEAKVKEGNQIRLATSYNKKDWQLVEGESAEITDRLEAIGNPVIYHNVTMPTSVTGARIEGGATQVVRGMPFSIKVSAINPAQRVTVAVNGENMATRVANANVSIPAVKEDLDVTIMVTDADAGDYMVFNIQEGQLATTLADCPERVKLIGSMLVSDFNAIRAKASTIIDLDMADVTIKGAAMTGNTIPENAFAPSNASSLSALRTIILPNNLERISNNAFGRCTQITEITIPANVTYIGNGAFSACTSLKKIIAKPKVAPTCGNLSPFPSGAGNITLEVPKGSEESYSVPSTYWAMLNLYKTPADAKEYYWVKVDKSRVGVIDYKGDLNSIAVGSADMQFILELPNCQNSGLKAASQTYKRPEVPFKLYDNGVDVFANLSSYQYESGTRVFPDQHWSMNGGRLGIRYLHANTSGPWMPQNHTIDIYFYYSINFENKAGGEGITAQVVEVPEGCEWKNVPMVYFKYSATPNSPYPNTEVKPVLYKEGSEIKFQLSNIPDRTEPVVSLMTKVMTKTGKTPEYEEREMTLEGDNGIYTIPALQGDCWVRISGIKTYDEGDPIPADVLGDLKKENVEFFTELTVTGEMDESAFETIRDNFESVETIDLSQIENETIPADAFAGMDNLRSVVLPATVTEIGEGAFKDCANIGTLTLPGVNSIGEGAFEGCESLTSILIPSAGSTATPAQAPKRVARVGSGITAESFRGVSPNCLIYVGETDIPDSDEYNIIVNRNGTRTAASDIHLDSNYPFSAPASFNLGDFRISMTVNVAAAKGNDENSGWTGLMLPFTPTAMEAGAEFAAREGSGLSLLSFDNAEAETLTHQESIEANRPYLAHFCAPFESVPVTFYATAHADGVTGYDVPFTPMPEENMAEGKDFMLYGSYDGMSAYGLNYVLDETGAAFVRPEGENPEVAPYSAYLTPKEGIDVAKFDIGSHPVWVFEPVAGGRYGSKLYRGGQVELATETRNAEIYYTLDGSDPSVESDSRILYEAPFDLDGDAMTLNAVALYNNYSSDKVTLAFELKKVSVDYDLVHNWNWISHNMENPVAVEDFATEDISRIVSQTQEVVRDPMYGLFGNLKELVPAQAYKVCVSSDSWNGNISGVAYNPENVVKLHAGWNWIGNPVGDDASTLISDLLKNLEATPGDMIVGLDGFEQYDADSTWKGTLTSLKPGVGYMYYSNAEKEFFYNQEENLGDNDDDQHATPTRAPWNVDNHKYPSVMPLTAALISEDGDRVDASEYIVGAFCGNECRGIGVNVSGMYMINVHGNPGDQINFRFITPDNEQFLSETILDFAEMPASSFMAPYQISMKGAPISSVEALENGEFALSIENGKVVLSGDLNSVISLEVFDLDGHRVAAATAAGAGKLSTDKLVPGVHIVLVRTESAAAYQKVMVK